MNGLRGTNHSNSVRLCPLNLIMIHQSPRCAAAGKDEKHGRSPVFDTHHATSPRTRYTPSTMWYGGALGLGAWYLSQQ